MSGPDISGYRSFFEQNYHGQLPYIYNSEVRDRLNDLAYSLDVMIRPEKTMEDISKREKYQGYRQEYVNQHLFWSHVPYSISLGNTYHVMPFSSVDFSTTNIKGSSSSNRSSKKEEKEEMSALTRGAIFLISSLFLYIAAEGIGRSIGELNAADQDLGKIEKIKPFVDRTQGQINYMDCYGQIGWIITEMGELQQIINDRFFSQVRNNALQNLMLKVGVAVSALITMTGALIASKAVIVGGVLFATLAGASLVIKSSIAKNDPTIKQSARELQRKVQEFVVRLNTVPSRNFAYDLYAGQFTQDNQVVYFVNRPEQPVYTGYNPQELGASAPLI